MVRHHSNLGLAGVAEADTIRLAVCHCPDVHIDFLDPHGKPFAHAQMTLQEFANMVRNVGDAVQVLGHQLPPAEPVDAIGATMGSG